MMKYAINAYGIATAAARSPIRRWPPTAEKADKMVDERLATAITADANDFIYQWEASHDYNPAPSLEEDRSHATVINAADDERNPPETGVHGCGAEARQERPPVPDPGFQRNARPSHDRHAKFYKQQLEELLQTAPQRRCKPAKRARDVGQSFSPRSARSPARSKARISARPISASAKRIFATLGYPDICLGHGEIDIRAAIDAGRGRAEIFRPVPGGWGRQGYTNVLLQRPMRRR